MLGHKLSPGTKPSFLNLRKPGLVPGKSLSPSIKIDPVEENYLTLNMTNRMRSFHTHVITCITLYVMKTLY